ncbi:FadR/GntR family transcriptional regulator [Cupriavidus sp. YAF13]|uniref:FadR/GntR family transcriptional regulator n=1 Tax=Cupriavidus sp. YAF13 TaxID=3233075 RepID=UPI003F8E9A80
MQESVARAKSQPQRVVDGISHRINDGVLRPGDRVPSEPELMREFGVSRTVVREAMSRLQAHGIVETLQGKGTFVLAPPVAQPILRIGAGDFKARQVLAMLELRIILESEAASLAALRRADQHLKAMREALDAFDAHRRAGVSTVEDDYRFHAQISAATGNEYFEEVLGSLERVTIARRVADAAQPLASESAGAGPRFSEPLPSLESGKDIAQAEHEAIYDAIRRADAAAARAAMFLHLSNSRERLRAKVGE